LTIAAVPAFPIDFPLSLLPHSPPGVFLPQPHNITPTSSLAKSTPQALLKNDDSLSEKREKEMRAAFGEQQSRIPTSRSFWPLVFCVYNAHGEQKLGEEDSCHF